MCNGTIIANLKVPYLVKVPIGLQGAVVAFLILLVPLISGFLALCLRLDLGCFLPMGDVRKQNPLTIGERTDLKTVSKVFLFLVLGSEDVCYDGSGY